MPGYSAKNFAVADILSDVLSSQRGALYDLVPQGKALSTEFDYAPKKHDMNLISAMIESSKSNTDQLYAYDSK